MTVTKALGFGRIVALRAARVDRISGGEARHAMLARAFATEPDVFLLDEPTADLDPAAQPLRAAAAAFAMRFGTDAELRLLSPD